MATPARKSQGMCMACGSVTGRWSAVRVGDQPVRLNNEDMY
jgi:hypothetical protein